jgi:two-component system, OmpR family, phosphate regulon response regulator PhoB
MAHSMLLIPQKEYEKSPGVSKQSQHASSEAYLHSEIERKKILIVDDEVNIRIFLCNLLGNCGYQTIEAGDKDEGMQIAAREKPALIILDVTMPKESGIQMYRELKAHEALRDVPVIMVSTIDKKTFSFYQKFQGISRQKGIPDPGAYLEKPLEAEELIEVVRRLTQPDGCPLGEE